MIKTSWLSTLKDGQKISNTFALDVGAVTVDDAFLTSLLTAFNATGATEPRAKYLAMLKTVDTLDEIRVSQVPNPATPHEPVLRRSVFPAIAGTESVTTDDAPAEATATLTLQTGLTSKRYRGRMFVPPPRRQASMDRENWLVGGSWEAAVKAWRDWLIRLCVGSATRYSTGVFSGVNLGVYSRVADAAGDAGIQPCLGVRYNAKIHWLRSRAV